MEFIKFDIFKVLLLAAKSMDELMTGLESALNIQFGDGLIMDTQGDLLNLLVDQCEYDTDEDSVIYKYAFDDKWGSVPRTYHLQDRAYTVQDIKTLYDYLLDKFKYKEVNDESL